MVKISHKDDNEHKKLIEAFYQRLMSSYGYLAGQLGKEVAITDEAEADIAIWRTTESKKRQLIPEICVVVICREEHIKIDANNYLTAFKESSLGTVNFFVLHNLKETKVFYLDDAHGGAVEQFCDFPKAIDIADDNVLNAFVDRMRQNSKESLLAAFSKSHNIIRNNDKLSPEAAFDEISKVIFIKMLYEREPNNELVFTREKFLRDESLWLKAHKGNDYICSLFESVKQQYIDDGLFERNETLRIRRESFLLILDEFSNISLYGAAEDVKGVAFEAFLGKTFRGELGQFFTPRTIVNFMVDVLNVKEGELLCDPCCGSGGFLIRAFEKVQDDIDNDIHQQRQSILRKSPSNRNAISTLLGELDKSRKGSRYYKLCHDYFYGVDANVRMARTSKMNMIMHGDGHVGVYQYDGLLNVGAIKENMFDVILINPPFGVHVDRNMRMTQSGQSLSNLYELNSSNAEILFIERTINLLKPGGRAALVLPEGIFNNSTNSKVRKYVEKRAEILSIISIPADVFLSSGANIKPSILIIRKHPEDSNNGQCVNKIFCACKVNDAGINSVGMPSDNKQLTELAPILRDWIENGTRPVDNEIVRMLDCSEMEDWNVEPFFRIKQLKYREGIPVVKLGDVLHQVNNSIIIEDDVLYTRITVKLFNKGIVVRDNAYGSEIGTKKQVVVQSGQFVISKIDGKSGAFGFLPPDLDGAIVTPDFPVFEIDKSRVLPDYLELILANPSVLDNVKATSSGSTGRKRLSVTKFLNTRIPLPSLEEQSRYLGNIVLLRKRQQELNNAIDEAVEVFNDNIFEL